LNVKTHHVYDLNRVMEISEAADLMRVSQTQINTWIEQGRLALCQITGISNPMVVVPQSISEFVAEQVPSPETSRLVSKGPQAVGSPAPRNPDLEGLDPSFLEAASKLLKTAEQIKRLIGTGTLVVVDGTITQESMTAYKKFLHS
jgi:hypothetical protein